MTQMTLKDKQALFLDARDAYYNKKKPIMTDPAFDKLENELKRRCPSWGPLSETGAPVASKKTKATLPFFMPSLSKHYPHQIQKWVQANRHALYLVMDKLDGSSLLVVYEHGNPIKLYTRGNGKVGGDISFMIPQLQQLPRNIKDKTRMAFRCEALLSKKAYAKWKKHFDDPRSMVNGQFNRTLKEQPHPALKDVDIVVLGMMGTAISWSLDYAKKLGFTVVPHKVTPKLNFADMLASRKALGTYEVDGLVICGETTKMIYENSDRPKWATAFKENLEDEADETTVVKIIYQVSPRRRIIPKILIEPINVNGVTVKHATCHNAKWMKDRKIGPGARVKVLRSGGVIPKIVDVVKPGKFQAPEVPYKMDGVHFVMADDSHEGAVRAQKLRALGKFLNTLGVEFIAAGSIATLYDAGATTPFHYMALAKRGDIAPMVKAGLGKVTSQKIMGELQRVFKATPLLQLMVASNIFGVGVGERRLTMIQKGGIRMTELLTLSRPKAERRLMEIRGFKTKTAAVVLDGVAEFKDFLETAKRFITVIDPTIKEKKVVKGKLNGLRVSFTGYRDTDEAAAIESNGGLVVPFGAQTQVLLHREGGKSSTKVEKAEAKGIRVCEFAELKI